MPFEHAPETVAKGLRRECLSFMEVVAQSVANIAPYARAWAASAPIGASSIDAPNLRRAERDRLGRLPHLSAL